ncbi:beta-lactamase [Lentzea aerocolonigenes]|uniref:Beta-lactamase n=1 Tax=Lentzea aerocolonigenes TaxID=68170 RepID=A0A0F0H120_LENAE|nr:MBL fold metallo-hydrolase [Lentzea aerocolonigenes]KJK47952.1 beta-lactamase [Lentzea aerocolonigenes]
MRLTVLGSCGAYPEPGRACSGFAVEDAGYRVALDLGYGTLPRLLGLWPAGPDAVVITHEHPDHCADLHGLFRMRYYGERCRLPLYCPPGVLDRLQGLEPDVSLQEVFDVHPLPGEWEMGPFRLTGIDLPHFVPNAGVRLESERVLAYTGDTGPADALATLGRGADLFIVEATDRPGDSSGLLMTAEAAGEWAREAGARRLMLTHFWPGNDRFAAVAKARRKFAGEIFAASEGDVYELRRGNAGQRA